MDAVPIRIGEYNILGDVLGEGAFSKVRMGVHPQTGERVALKVLKTDKLQLDENGARQVARELEAMERIQHPNVIGFKGINRAMKHEYANGMVKQRCVITLELAQGGELFDFLSYTGAFDEQLARTYMHQLVSGIAACHDRGVPHRDLKPENLLLDGTFVMKIADFGFAGAFGPAQQALMFTEVGTPAYMAPETINNRGYDAFKVDIWASGVILFIMLAGFPPFQKPTNNDWWFNKLNNNKHPLFWQAHSRNHYFSEDSKDFLNKIMCPNPERRISLNDMVQHRWFQGPTLTPQALLQEMQGRYQRVNQTKTLEKQAEAARAAQRARERGDGGLDDDVVRSLGGEALDADDDDLPSSSPDMLMFEKKRANFDDDLGGLCLDDEKEVEGTPPAYPEALVQCYTKFTSKEAADEVVDRICLALSSLGAKYEQDKQGFKFTAQMSHGAGRVSFTAQVYTDPKEEGSHIVEFRRRQGESRLYRAAYSAIAQQLVSIMA